ncbi:hypothetical protein SAMN05444671_1411 [Flavobacterium sp. CF108]|uniref:hypothetical protein n=1 Tax=unclassified Flavobacterium TaxID=196869 RepID=UPI0008B1626C|nr:MULTISPECIES: hypothetical protein [unclassified Flavobacterium]SEO79184.1 hypothetical protein SAMN04487978_3642 [Flavobacterium sp. fv08]SHG76375.1 hypothetical protein SAMN05444671_1411 [Flavobacterium sp. CF108]
MNITINLTTADLSVADKTLIKECLGLATDPEVDNALTKITKAAFMEYVKMFKEKGLPTRADEVQQERLFFLLLYYFENILPSENELSSIFQLTQSQSKTLLRNTKSRYRTKISSFIKNTLLETINSATQISPTDPYEFVCTSPTTVEELNLIISQKGPTLEPVNKIRGISSKYTCAIDTYNLLQQELN